MKIPLAYICLAHTERNGWKSLRRLEKNQTKNLPTMVPSFEKMCKPKHFWLLAQANEKVEEYETESLVDD